MLDIFPVAAVGQAVLFYLCLHQRRDAVHQHLDVKGLLLHHHLPGFQFAHVQHVVDQCQKMVSGEVYFIKAAVHLPGIVPVGAEDVQHTENAVDGGADVVAHAAQEAGLGGVGPLGLLGGVLQALILGLLLCMEDGGIPEKDDTVDDRHLPPGGRIKDGVLRHEDGLLEPDRLAAGGLLPVLHRHVLEARVEALQQF